MRYLKNLIYLALIANFLFSLGCSQKPPSTLESTSLEKEFLGSFNKTDKLGYPLDVTTKTVGKTFWIYIAAEKELLQISAMSGMGGFMPEKLIKFMDIKCQYENSAFNINYIFLKFSAEEKIKEQDMFQKSIGGSSLMQDFTYTTIEILQKTYFSIGSIISKTEDLNFFAICLADIKNGIKIIFVIHRLDMEQFLMNMLPSDEFYGRMILKTDGSKDLTDDKYGLSIQYNDISLTDFLEEQLANNIRAKVGEMEKYKPEELKATEKLDAIALETAYQVVTKYEFDDYSLVEVEDTISKEKTSFSKSKLRRMFGESPSEHYSEEYNF